jgi:hypothetical protein
MLEKLKTDFYNLLVQLGYNATDNGAYVENFPWLMLRTNGYELNQMRDAEKGTITLVLDIFSQYSGEKEIIEILENIADHLKDLYTINNTIIYAQQKSVKILDDNNKGPVRKHGVISYVFTVARAEKQEVAANGENVE